VHLPCALDESFLRCEESPIRNTDSIKKIKYYVNIGVGFIGDLVEKIAIEYDVLM